MPEEEFKCEKNISFITDESGNPIFETDDGESSMITEDSGTITQIPASEEDELPDVCKVTPIEAYMSTSLNSKITSFNKLATRILNMLGYPAVAVTDVHRDNLYEAISIACEMFTKYAGFTEENLIVDSRLYEPNKGIRIDWLYTIATMERTHKKNMPFKHIDRGPGQILRSNRDVYVTRVRIPKEDYFINDKDFEMLSANCKKADKDLLCMLHDYSLEFPNGIEELSILNGMFYNYLVSRRGYNKDQFKKSKDKVVTEGGQELTIYAEDDQLGRVRDDLYYSNTYDYDLMDYRKVISIKNYYEGSNASITSLFSTEFALAQQAFYSYQFSIRGFDMVSWQSLHELLDMRRKLLALERDWNFNPHTQYLTFIPQPRPEQHFIGVLQSYLEWPLRDVIKSPWVFQYALALVKIMIGNIRGKWGDVQLAGGGVVTGNVLGQQGREEKEKLEKELIEGTAFGDSRPPLFFVG